MGVCIHFLGLPHNKVKWMILNHAVSETGRGESLHASSSFCVCRNSLAFLVLEGRWVPDSIVTCPSTLVYDASVATLCPKVSLLRRMIFILD